MKAIAVVDPFTYAVHGFKELVLKNTGLVADQLRPCFPLRFHRADPGLSHIALSPDAIDSEIGRRTGRLNLESEPAGSPADLPADDLTNDTSLNWRYIHGSQSKEETSKMMERPKAI